jgi:hypothetical protein
VCRECGSGGVWGVRAPGEEGLTLENEVAQGAHPLCHLDELAPPQAGVRCEVSLTPSKGRTLFNSTTSNLEQGPRAAKS